MLWTDSDEIFRTCPKWDKEEVIRFGLDPDHCLDLLDPGIFKRNMDEIFIKCLKWDKEQSVKNTISMLMLGSKLRNYFME